MCQCRLSYDVLENAVEELLAGSAERGQIVAGALPEKRSAICLACGGCLQDRAFVAYAPGDTAQACTGASNPLYHDKEFPAETIYMPVVNWQETIAAAVAMSGWDLRSGLSMSLAFSKDFIMSTESRFTSALLQHWRANVNDPAANLHRNLRDLKHSLRGKLAMALECISHEALQATGTRLFGTVGAPTVVSIANWMPNNALACSNVWVNLGTGHPDLQREGHEPDLVDDEDHITALLPANEMQTIRLDAQSSCRLSLTLHPVSDSAGKVTGTRIAFCLDRFPTFLRARYCKFSRTLAQTSWYINGVRMGSDTSVEEIVSHTMASCFTPRSDGQTALDARDYVSLMDDTALFPGEEAFDPRKDVEVVERPLTNHSAALLRALTACIPTTFRGSGMTWNLTEDGRAVCLASADAGCKSAVEELIGIFAARACQRPLPVFHTAGREDIDVRMLGPGRPCMVELINVQRGVLIPWHALLAVQNAVNTASAAHEDVVELKGIAPSPKVCLPFVMVLTQA
jgi:hypothetical protein